MIKQIKAGDTAQFTINGNTVQIGVKSFTPEEAKTIIERSDKKFNNRKTRSSVVRQYARDMEEGRWKVNGDMLRFDKEGTLIDGKHRLSAVERQETPVEFLYVTGIDRNAVDTIDTGAKRSLENHLQLMSKCYEKGAACIVRAKLVLDKNCLHTGQSDSNAGYSMTEQVEEYEKHKPEYDYAVEFAKRIAKKDGALNVSEVGAVFMHLTVVLGWDRQKVEDFFESFGSVSRNGDTIFNKTVKKLENKRVCKGADRTKALISCWNSDLAGKDTQLLKFNEGDWFKANPEVEASCLSYLKASNF